MIEPAAGAEKKRKIIEPAAGAENIAIEQIIEQIHSTNYN